MIIIKTISEIHEYISKIHDHKTIGFVPTMGSFHEGHISLIKKCVEENKESICSLFVNPKQFNEKEDYENYPCDLKKDIKIISKTKCKVLFAPSKEEIYPQNNITKEYDFDGIEKILEGERRPGHFYGVGIILEKLFDLIKPYNVYFGEKDFQQCVIVNKLIKQKFKKINLFTCKTIRDQKGLALSSRNRLLSFEEKQASCLIYENLVNAKKNHKKTSIQKIKQDIYEKLNSHELIKVEYVDIRKKNNFEVLKDFSRNDPAIILVAVKVGKIRLIDNITI